MLGLYTLECLCLTCLILPYLASLTLPYLTLPYLLPLGRARVRFPAGFLDCCDFGRDGVLLVGWSVGGEDAEMVGMGGWGVVWSFLCTC